MNEWDQIARDIVRQTQTPGQTNRMAATGSAQSQNVTSTMTDANGNPLRLWIPGVDPWGVPGFYFGQDKIDIKDIVL